MSNIELQKEIARLETVVQGLKQERDELAAMVAVKDAALRGVIEWDKRRDFIVPYKVRDPIHKALSITGPAAVHEIRARAFEEAAEYFKRTSFCDCGMPCDCFSAGTATGELKRMAAAEIAKGEK